MPRLRKVSLGGSPGVDGRWDAQTDAPAIVLEAVSAGPEDTFVAVFHGEHAVGRVLLIDGEWHWSLRSGGDGYARTRRAALAALAKSWSAQRRRRQ
jgi:hypothetical protein